MSKDPRNTDKEVAVTAPYQAAAKRCTHSLPPSNYLLNYGAPSLTGFQMVGSMAEPPGISSDIMPA